MGSMLTKKETQPIDEEGVVKLILSSKKIAALTGAGASAESGVPTFRDPSDGIWEKYSVADCGTKFGFYHHPDRLWRMLSEYIETRDPQPNPTHYALAKLEKLGKLRGIITQNVDRLHQDAGSKNVVEYHGTLMETICTTCGKVDKMDKKVVRTTEFRKHLPPKCACGGILKPNAVLFGEWIPRSANTNAQKIVKDCDLVLVIGTSGTVAPANSLPWTASKNGATIVEINKEPSALTNSVSDFLFKNKSSRLMRIVELVESQISPVTDVNKNLPDNNNNNIQGG